VVIVIAVGSKVYRFKPGRGVWIVRAIKIRSTTSWGWKQSRWSHVVRNEAGMYEGGEAFIVSSPPPTISMLSSCFSYDILCYKEFGAGKEFYEQICAI
jgi:hypothetical protein